MPGEVDARACGEARDLEQAGDTAAAGDVRLQAVHRACLEQVPEVGEHVAVLPRSDLEPAGARLPQEPQSGEVGRGDRLLEPGDPPFTAVATGPAERLFPVECSVRVDEELGVVADRPSRGIEARRIRVRVAAEVHLPPGDAAGPPAAELLGEAFVRVGGEAAAPVDGYFFVRSVEETGERKVEQ